MLYKYLKVKFQDTLKDLFINFQCEGTQSHYLSRIGEIGVLDRILSKRLKVIDIEEKLPNNKSIDFTVQYADEVKLLEVRNIELKMEKIKDVSQLIEFMEKIFMEKINDKLKNLDDEILNRFRLIPVLHGSLDDFAKYEEIFEWLNQYKPIILPPLGLYYCGSRDGKTMYVFETIENIRELGIKERIK